ncbi:DUF4389 domain-containing protein [Paraglaciecola arctica]|uniref:DUF4389 domain-containing protein n=1 Tax=Paraglaciecola arctica TaxID=1128911 RepID=UPI001C06ACFB|nr:DUF4389 domain-containing protein [Paraglaciecola arctica]MBU3002066.1 DUF4389 domain-containing protein [Paraglaciecola arctica]
MDDKTKKSLTNLETWKRGLFMVLFAIISGVAKLLVTLVAIFQFITVLFKGQTNETTLPLGQSLSTYIYQITLFLTFNTDEMPFPFKDYPDGAPESSSLKEETQNSEAEVVTSVIDDQPDQENNDTDDNLTTNKTLSDDDLKA